MINEIVARIAGGIFVLIDATMADFLIVSMIFHVQFLGSPITCKNAEGLYSDGSPNFFMLVGHSSGRPPGEACQDLKRAFWSQLYLVYVSTRPNQNFIRLSLWKNIVLDLGYAYHSLWLGLRWILPRIVCCGVFVNGFGAE
jgi:hypothetical protein